MGIFPVVPGHSLSTDLAVKVQTIQVGSVAFVVPPGALIKPSAVASMLVIIAILGGKCLASMISKGITSSA